MQPEQVRLTGATETLLITLQAKAAESAMPDSLLRDRFAADALHRLDPDGRHLEIGHDMTIGIALRAYMLDRWTEAFLQRCTEATVLHLGCGLDSRIFRIDPGPRVRWFELDVPDVISLRKRIYPGRAGCTTIACSIVERGWIERLPADRPTMIVAEGVLPYLEDHEVSQVLRRIAGHFPEGEIAFDAYSSTAIRLLRFNPAIRATGAVSNGRSTTRQSWSGRYRGYGSLRIVRIGTSARWRGCHPPPRWRCSSSAPYLILWGASFGMVSERIAAAG